MFKIEAALRMHAATDSTPSIGDTIEFLSDNFTDKGPATGEIIRSFVTVDGPYVTVKFSDSQQMFSWDDLSPCATKSGSLWKIDKE